MVGLVWRERRAQACTHLAVDGENVLLVGGEEGCGALAEGVQRAHAARVVVGEWEAEDARGHRPVGVRIIALVAQVDHRVLVGVLAVEKIADRLERITVQRLDARSGQAERDYARCNIREIEVVRLGRRAPF